MLTNFLAQHNLSTSTSDHLGILIHDTFSDSSTSPKITFGLTKVTALLNGAIPLECKYFLFLIEYCKTNLFSICTYGCNDT